MFGIMERKALSSQSDQGSDAARCFVREGTSGQAVPRWTHFPLLVTRRLLDVVFYIYWEIYITFGAEA